MSPTRLPARDLAILALQLAALGLHLAEAPGARLVVLFALLAGLVPTLRPRPASASAIGTEALGAALAQTQGQLFDQWKLTASEREIARLSLQGLEAFEISKLRAASLGTVRAQFARLCTKAGVSNRSQLSALVLAELAAMSRGDTSTP